MTAREELENAISKFRPGEDNPPQILKDGGYVQFDRWRGVNGCWLWTSKGAQFKIGQLDEAQTSKEKTP